MALGADYSDARPGGAALRAAGVTGVGRYLATDSRGITAAEYQDLTAHGVGVWLVREGAATGMLNGYAKGVSDASLAVAQIAACGLPQNSVVYAAADFDVWGAQEVAACDDYMRGFASVIGTARTGIYGGLYYLNHCGAAGLAKWFWESASTSFAHGEVAQVPIHLQQTTNTPPLPGTDHDIIYDTTTFAGGNATPIPEEVPDVKNFYQRSDRRQRALKPGDAAYLSTPIGGAVNVIGGVGAHYSITPHFEGTGFAPGDSVTLQLQWQNGDKSSWHYPAVGVAGQDGVIALSPEFKHGAVPGDAVYVYVKAAKTNKQAGTIILIDSDAYLFS